MTRSPITPETKVGQLLADYPELEPVLIGLAPAFEKLKNPILRRTVARVATLAQAARIAGMEPRALVGHLREAAGLASAAPEDGAAPSREATAAPEPPWVAEHTTVARLDADALLEAGQHPISALGPRLSSLAPGEKLELLATFDPVPLTDALTSRGFRVWTQRNPDGGTLTFIAPALVA